MVSEKEIYLKEVAKTQRGKMKKRLLEWGGALELCKRKHEEIRKINHMIADVKGLTVKRPLRVVSEHEHPVLESVIDYYTQEIRRITEQIGEIMAEKQKMESLLEGLTAEEQEFIFLRYEKGYGYDYISLKIHMSRAQCFRVNDKALDKLIHRSYECIEGLKEEVAVM